MDTTTTKATLSFAQLLEQNHEVCAMLAQLSEFELRETKDNRDGTFILRNRYSFLDLAVFPKSHFIVDKDWKWAIAKGINPEELYQVVQEIHEKNKTEMFSRLVKKMREICHNSIYNFYEDYDDFSILHKGAAIFKLRKDLDSPSCVNIVLEEMKKLPVRMNVFEYLLKQVEIKGNIIQDLKIKGSNSLVVSSIFSQHVFLYNQSFENQVKEIDHFFNKHNLKDQRVQKILSLAKKYQLYLCSVDFLSFYTYSVEFRSINKEGEAFELKNCYNKDFKSEMNEVEDWAKKFVEPYNYD